MSFDRTKHFQECIGDPPLPYRYVQNGKYYNSVGFECNEAGQVLSREEPVNNTKIGANGKPELIEDHDVIDLTEVPAPEPAPQAAPRTVRRARTITNK